MPDAQGDEQNRRDEAGEVEKLTTSIVGIVKATVEEGGDVGAYMDEDPNLEKISGLVYPLRLRDRLNEEKIEIQDHEVGLKAIQNVHQYFIRTGEKLDAFMRFTLPEGLESTMFSSKKLMTHINYDPDSGDILEATISTRNTDFKVGEIGVLRMAAYFDGEFRRSRRVAGIDSGLSKPEPIEPLIPARMVELYVNHLLAIMASFSIDTTTREGLQKVDELVAKVYRDLNNTMRPIGDINPGLSG